VVILGPTFPYIGYGKHLSTYISFLFSGPSYTDLLDIIL
jgi:hypothetical protein